ncbi:MAG: cell division protein FtsA [Candidatus Omnitrophica bacterium]|nr:cell division protein FtsA [Candidatus Omnitrophota bacterium]
MINDNYVCTLDIGTSKIAGCLAKYRKKRIEELFLDSVLAKGIKAGAVVDSIELVSAIDRLVKILKAKSGVNIKVVHVNVSGQEIVTRHSRAIVPLAERGNKVITGLDVQRVNEQARILASSLEEEIIHMIPSGYTIDSKSNISNPVGLYSHRLEVDLYLVLAKLSQVQSISRAFAQAGFEIKSLSLSGMAGAKAALDKELKTGLNIFCDIGSDITEMLIFRDGILKDVQILAAGSANLTLQLAEVLKIPAELAEDIKRSYGIIGEAQKIKEDKEILVKKEYLYRPIRQKDVCEILTSGAKQISFQIKEALEKKASTYEVNNFVVVGRGVLLEGFIELLENTLNIPVRLGRISDSSALPVALENRLPELSGSKYLTYLTSLGMALRAIEDKDSLVSDIHKAGGNPLKKAIQRVREVYHEYF